MRQAWKEHIVKVRRLAALPAVLRDEVPEMFAPATRFTSVVYRRTSAVYRRTSAAAVSGYRRTTAAASAGGKVIPVAVLLRSGSKLSKDTAARASSS
eukprot:4958171-Prymnesium_polylepis.2